MQLKVEAFCCLISLHKFIKICRFISMIFKGMFDHFKLRKADKAS